MSAFVFLFGLLFGPAIERYLVQTAWKWIQESSGISISAADVSWKWPVGLVVRHAVLRDPNQKAVVHGARITVRGPGYVPGAGFSLGSLEWNGGTVLLERGRQDSVFSLQKSLAPLLEGPPAEKPTPWTIHRLSMKNLRVIYSDARMGFGVKTVRIQNLEVLRAGQNPEGDFSTFLKELSVSDPKDKVALKLQTRARFAADGTWNAEDLRCSGTGFNLSGTAHGKGIDTLDLAWDFKGRTESLLRWPQWLGWETDTLPQRGALSLSGTIKRTGSFWQWNRLKGAIPGIQLASTGRGHASQKTFRVQKAEVEFDTRELLQFWPESFLASVRSQIPEALAGTATARGKAATAEGGAWITLQLTTNESARAELRWVGPWSQKEKVRYTLDWGISVPGRLPGLSDSLEVGPVLAHGSLEGTGWDPESWSGKGELALDVARISGIQADGLRSEFDWDRERFSAGWNWNNPTLQAHGAHEWMYLDSVEMHHEGDFTVIRWSPKEMGWVEAPAGGLSGKWRYSYSSRAKHSELEVAQLGANWRTAQGGNPLGAFTAEAHTSGTQNQVQIQGDALNARIEWSGAPDDWQKLLNSSWEERFAGKVGSNESFVGIQAALDLNVKNLDPWLHIADTSLHVASGTTLMARIQGTTQRMEWGLTVPNGAYGGNSIHGLTFQGITTSDRTALGLDLDSLTGATGRCSIAWNATGGAGELSWNFKGRPGSELAWKGSTHGQHRENGHWDGVWQEGALQFPQTLLKTQNQGRWTWNKNSWSTDSVLWSGDRASLWIAGTVSGDPRSEFHWGIQGLPLELFQPWLDASNTSLAGRLEARSSVRSVLGTPGIEGALSVDSLVWNREWMGRLTGNATFSRSTQISTLGFSLDRGERKTVSIRASYDPRDDDWPVQATVHVDRLRLMALQPYLAGTLDRFRGTARGEVKLQWSTSKYVLTGELEFPSFAASIPLLGTDYGVDGVPRLTLTENQWTLHPTALRDTKEKTQGTLRAVFRPNKFKDPRLDLTLEATDLLALDLPQSDLFFGKVYAKGTVQVSGPLDALKLDVRAEAAKPSTFKLPFSTPTEYEANSSISFVQPASSTSEPVRTEVARGLDVSLALKVTPLMTMELLLDETVGDIIRGRGEGWMKVDYPPTGALRLNGSVTLTGGDYLFTLQNLINKSFEVEPGGTLSWTGDPYAGKVNLRALYTTRTTLTGMVNQPDYGGQRVPVQLGLQLSGALMQPQLAFDFALPNANPAWQEELRNRLADGDKRNIQAFSLLLTNSFWQSNEGVLSQSVQSVNANTTQMLASQFSNFLSQGLGDFVAIDLAYSGSNRSDARDQLEVALSKAFLNDRVSVQTTLDVPVGRQGATNSTSGLVGDVQVNYKITEDGRWKARAFNRSNNNNPALDRLSPYTQGVGVEFGTQANTWKTLFRRRKKKQ